MSGIDVPNLAYAENMAHHDPETFKPSPPYEEGLGQGLNVHNHYIQAPVEAPNAKSWYRRKAGICSIIGLTALVIVVGLSVGLAIFAIKMRHNTTAEVSTTAPTSTPSPTPLPLPPSTRSNLGAVDINFGRADLHRRLVIWQDSTDALVVRESTQDNKTRTSRISKGSDKIPDAMSGTPLAAAADDEGVTHLFYVSDDESTVIHLTQSGEGWTSQGELGQVFKGSSLSATWHKSRMDGEGVVVLAYVNTGGQVSLKVSPEPGFDEWRSFEPDEFKTMSGWGSANIAVTSGLFTGVSRVGPGLAADWVGLNVVLEGRDAAEVVECTVVKRNISGCYRYENSFSQHDGKPITIASHPTYLSWSRLRPKNGSLPMLDGFLTLESYKSSLLYHRVIPRIPDPQPTGGTTVYHSDVETREVIDRAIHAMAVTDGRALFARSGTKVLGFRYRDDDWEIWREVETIISDEGED